MAFDLRTWFLLRRGYWSTSHHAGLSFSCTHAPGYKDDGLRCSGSHEHVLRPDSLSRALNTSTQLSLSVERVLTNSPQGYVLLEYPTQAEAQSAISALNGTKLLDQTIHVDYAFVRPPPKDNKSGANRSGGGGVAGKGRGAGTGRGGRSRSRSKSRERSREGEEDRDGKDGGKVEGDDMERD
jgi:RNA recognition motif-containing protein